MTSVRPCEAEGMSGVMDWCSPRGLKLMLLVAFLSTSTVSLRGNPITGLDHDLHCVNDFLFTINCSLRIAPSENTSDSNSSYWLTIMETFEQEKFVCPLANTNWDYFCSMKTSDRLPDDDYYPQPFVDTDTFKISLCHNDSTGSENCEVLDDNFAPMTSIVPNPPCCLTVSHNSSQHHFTWKSTYEEYDIFNDLINNLKYQLHYNKRGDTHDVKSYEINTDSTNFSVDDREFVPDAEYSARVRSSPDLAHYKGQWSKWSSEVHWRTESAVNEVPSDTFIYRLGKKVFIPLCALMTLVLLVGYAQVKRWRRSAFIPTPAPYFHTLYSDCQGDFKSWVVTQENTIDVLKAEETLQIDMLSKCADVKQEEEEEEEKESQPPFHRQLTEGSTYSNITDPGCDTSLLGVPYAVSTMAPGSSLMSLTLSSQPGSPAVGDSGCWLCSHTSLEKDPPWYCNEYCTLNSFQQINPVNKTLPNGDDHSGCHY
ncbi:interleukin-21 receptor [Pempheris klunzingeri]|uniref:interleukin-21 receptor n=1 Tax=Pempheris klunzingeri TaxID=3127111 RepID=UPI003980F616